MSECLILAGLRDGMSGELSLMVYRVWFPDSVFDSIG